MIRTSATIRGTKNVRKVWVELSNDEAWEVAKIVVQGLISKWDGQISELEQEKAKLIGEMNHAECKERMKSEFGFVFP